jgi:concanavalin A-like lectin/glucanase superfamily protein
MSNLTLFRRGYGRDKPGAWSRIDSSHPIAKKMVGCWLFSEGGGSARDLTSSAITGTVDTGVNRAPGFFGQGLNFTGGSNNWVNLGDAAPLRFASSTSFSFVVWFKNIGSIALSPGLVEKGIGSISGNITNPWYIFRIISSGKMELNLRNTGGTDTVVDSNTSVNDANWHQGVAVADWTAQKLYIYVDGKQDNSTAWTLADAYGTNGEVAELGDAQGLRAFIGLMDHVLAFQRALSPAEVLALFVEPFCFLQQGSLSQYMTQSPAAASYTTDMFPYTETFDVTPARRAVVSY